MISFSIVTARAAGLMDKASITRRNAFVWNVDTGARGSVDVNGNDVNDAGRDQHEKQRYVQHVPDREESLVDPEFHNFAGSAHSALHVVECDALEAIALSRDGSMA